MTIESLFHMTMAVYAVCAAAGAITHLAAKVLVRNQ